MSLPRKDRFKIRSDFFTYKTYHKQREEEKKVFRLIGSSFLQIFFYAGGQTAYLLSILSIVQIVYFITAFIAALFLFPLYLKVFNLNRVKEKDSPIYPIISHFHWIVIFQLIIVFIFVFYDYLVSLVSFLPHFEMGFVSFFLVFTTSPVFSILLTLLAIQRFIIYFSPDHESSISFKSTSWKILVTSLYFSSFLVNSGLFYSKIDWDSVNDTEFSSFLADYKKESFVSRFEEIYLLFEFIIEFVSILSVILYCPIFISIRTKLHLISAVQSKPDRYIRYQAVFICLSKLPSLLIGIKLMWFGYMQVSELRFGFIIHNMASFGATPFIIQLTYLCCNRRNVQVVWSIISPRRFLCGNCRRGNMVAPVDRAESTIM